MWSNPIDFRLVVQHLAFLGIYNWHQFDFVIWSLIQELRISLIFPLLFAFVKWVGKAKAILVGLALSGIAVVIISPGVDTSARYSLGMTLHYITFFILGIIFASSLKDLERWWTSLSSLDRRIMFLGGLVLYSFHSLTAIFLLTIFRQEHLKGPYPLRIISNCLVALGAVPLILVCLKAARAKRLVMSAPAQFLGKISYSLYLTHPLILFSLTFSFGPHISIWVQFLAYVTGAILFGWVFYLVVEQPCIRLSRAL